jgi:hypothetical protein
LKVPLFGKFELADMIDFHRNFKRVVSGVGWSLIKTCKQPMPLKHTIITYKLLTNAWHTAYKMFCQDYCQIQHTLPNEENVLMMLIYNTEKMKLINQLIPHKHTNVVYKLFCQDGCQINTPTVLTDNIYKDRAFINEFMHSECVCFISSCQANDFNNEC